MRPVNLIPPEERRGDRAPLRAGAMSYILIGTCVVALGAVLALVLTENSITEKENEVAQLEVAREAASQRASALAPYAEFASLQQQRELTIQSLAQSRFDWERVLRELALVTPGSITLDSLEASATGEGEASTADTAGVPTLTISGCGPTHDSVAEFVAALEDIDGITRVGLQESRRDGSDPEGGSPSASGSAAGAAAEGAGTCPPKAAVFTLSATFDGVTPPAGAEAAPAAPATPTAPAETNSAAEQTQEAENAANLVPGAAR